MCWTVWAQRCVTTPAPPGTYSWLGRSSDAVKAGGILVSPAEVEERLLQHPDVVEAAVAAAAESGLEKLDAFIAPRPGRKADAESIIAWCREGLAAFKRPPRIRGDG
jgi:benzoate-CoA ligase